MNRIQQIFKNGPAFVGYLTAGDGGVECTFDAAMALIAGGVNILEIGVPFSDPIADGPVIQRAAARALENNLSLEDMLALIKKLRAHTDIPLILFSYLNPILKAVEKDFLTKAKQAGLDGILLVDCPYEEAKEIHQQCIKNHLAPIYVVTPTTSVDRLKHINKYGSGFLYYACRKGTTGVRNAMPEDMSDKLREIKAISHHPVVVGFGISNKEMAAEVLQHADGFVVGSLFVKALEDGMSFSDLTVMAKNLLPENVAKE
jgi:tryptophan synthase alpha chain